MISIDPAPVDPPDAADALDRLCLRATADGDRAGFEQLYRRHHPRLARFLRRFTVRLDLIDDVINDAMWVVWRQAGAFRGQSRASTWITGIAYRCMLKGLRGGAPAEEVSHSSLDLFDINAVAGEVGDTEPVREMRDWLASGLRTLPEDQRMTLEMAYFLGYSCEEIAEAMGCAVGTVKARMFHARVRLRSVMPALGGIDARGPNAARG